MAQQDTAYDIAECTDLPRDEQAVIEGGINAHSAAFDGFSREKFFIAVRDQGVLIGGMQAFHQGTDFYIKHLWVDAAYRRQGLALEMMDRAGQEAQRRGCQTIWVDTLSYQAPEFYKKAGYEEAGRIEGYRGAHDRIFLRKSV
ncbi:MAG: GNAT family N-acetyltransferase [Rhodospirillales bacterium]|nr:GNAT family N-acetyltransferase [Rhodospirillales bacterium]